MTHFYAPLEHSKFSVSFGKEDIEMFFVNRSAVLARVQSAISPKFYELLKQKIEKEKQAMIQLYIVEEEKQKTLSHYSFVLPASFFEQKFYGNDE